MRQLRAFKEARHRFLRVDTQGHTRLTISTFLTGLTFAAFAALLNAPPLAPAPGSSLTPDQLLFTLSRTLMSIATLLFLLTAASTYAALQSLADVSPSAAKNLGDGVPCRLDPRDAERLRVAYTTYTAASHWVPWGLAVLLLSLPLIGWRTSPLIGGATLLTAAILGIRLRPLLGAAVDGMRGARRYDADLGGP